MSVYRPKGKDGKPRSPHWHYDFILRGRRFSGSTGATTRAEAERIEKLKRTEAAKPRDETTINGAFDLWWAEKGQHDAKPQTTFGRMERLQDLLADILQRDGQALLLSTIKTKHLAEYATRRRGQLDHRQRLPAPATINRELQILQRIMRYAVDVWEAELVLPRFSRAFSAEPDAAIRALSQETVAALREALRPDYRDAFDWLLLAGARAGNAVATDDERWLKPDDIDLSAGVARWRVKSRKPGGRLVEIPLSTAMTVLLANNLGHHPDAVFTYVARTTREHRGGERIVRGQRYPITYGAFYAAFKAAAKVIGRPELRVHDLRHTAGTNTLRATGNLVMAQQLLAHQSNVSGQARPSTRVAGAMA